MRTIGLTIFFPIELPLNAQLTDFEIIQFDFDHNQCMDIANLNIGYLFSPLKINLEGVTPIDQEYRISSRPTVQFDIGFKQSNFKITSTINGKTTSSSEEFVSDEFKRFQGTANALEIDLSKSKSLVMSEAFCATYMYFARSSPTEYDALVTPNREGVDTKGAIRTSQLISANSSVIIILEGPVIFQDDPNNVADKITITLVANDEAATLLVGAEGSERFYASLPGIKFGNDKETNTEALPAGNSFSISNGSNIAISSPTGKIKFGSFPEITLSNLLTLGDSNVLLFPTLPSWVIRQGEHTGYSYIHGDIEKDEITISGTTPRLIYSGKEYSISRWSLLPDYVQTGIFGLVIGAFSTGIGVLWKRNENRKAKKSGDEAYQPEKGAFVCILDSGYVIAGKLIERPSFFSPYYVIQDAHRKHRDEESWETDIVKQINIKASRVEQHYIKE